MRNHFQRSRLSGARQKDNVKTPRADAPLQFVLSQIPECGALPQPFGVSQSRVGRRLQMRGSIVILKVEFFGLYKLLFDFLIRNVELDSRTRVCAKNIDSITAIKPPCMYCANIILYWTC